METKRFWFNCNNLIFLQIFFYLLKQLTQVLYFCFSSISRLDPNVSKMKNYIIAIIIIAIVLAILIFVGILIAIKLHRLYVPKNFENPLRFKLLSLLFRTFSATVGYLKLMIKIYLNIFLLKLNYKGSIMQFFQTWK